jgi:hypothetical protein
VKGFENFAVSNFGRVFNIFSGRMINSFKSNTGYLRIQLRNEKGYKNFYVHRLVLLNFIGEKKGLVVNHKNGDKFDNRFENLEWVTQSENVLHSYRTGLRKDNSYKVILMKDGSYITKFKNARETSEFFGISRKYVDFLSRIEKEYNGFILKRVW